MYRSRTPLTPGQHEKGQMTERADDLISNIGITNTELKIVPNHEYLYLGFPGMETDRQSYYTKDRIIGIIREEGEMTNPFPPWSVIVLEHSSVNSIRQEFNMARKMGLDLIGIRFDGLNPRYTPESKARMGVYIVQIASFSRRNVVASLPPGRFGGRVDERFLPELVRLEMLMTLASQGFAWLELEEDIPLIELKEIAQRAHTSNTKVLLTKYQKGTENWIPPSAEILETVDGYKLEMTVENKGDLQRVLRASKLVRDSLKGKLKVIKIRGPELDELGWLSPALGSDLALLDPRSDTDMRFGDPIRMKSEAPMDFWKRTGIIGDGASKEWSLLKREINENTSIIAQIGRQGDADYKVPLHNSVFNRMDTDAMVLPWYTSRGGVDRFFRMVRTLGINGVVIDMPFMTDTMPSMDWTDGNSKRIGALNLAVGKSGKLYGYNTELYATMDVLKEHSDPGGSSILVLGCGVSGKSAALASSILGARTTISGSTMERTLEVVSSIGEMIEATTYHDLGKGGKRFDIIINTLPAELSFGRGDEGLTVADMVRGMEPSLGIDMVRSSLWTPFLSAIESRGGEAVPGTEVLVHTIKRDQKLLLGKEVPEEMVGEILTFL
ncbi:MAG: type I 3-dehydroquinate dehydratase [Thermoplasmatota archaeon]